MAKLRLLLALSFTLIFTVALHAQSSTTTQSKNNSGSAIAIITGTSFPNISSKNPGLPFSADVIDETDRVLADGNHIHHESHGKIFRDSQGRTRLESELDIGRDTPITHVTISDPVEGLHMMLDLANKTATVSHFSHPSQSSGSGEKKPAQTRQTAIQRNPAAAERIHSTRGETKEIEGFAVTATRNTRTIPAGAKGNDKPLVITNESWFSEDLATVLLTVRDDPESGKSTRKLVNIHTGDPDPLLFKVPADFTVKDIPQQ